MQRAFTVLLSFFYVPYLVLQTGAQLITKVIYNDKQGSCWDLFCVEVCWITLGHDETKRLVKTKGLQFKGIICT